MQKSSKIIIIFIALTLLLTINCSATNITDINALIENISDYDEMEVTIRGELIGEELERGEYSWLNIHDKTNAIGVWIKRSDLNGIKFYGNYKHIGDIVEVTGVFHRACSEHGGDVDIHCADIKIVQTGYTVSESISPTKVLAAVGLSAVAVSIGIIYLKLMKKPKRIKSM